MKTIKTITLFIILISIVSCKSTKTMITNKLPFKIEKATYSNWIDDVKNEKGTKVELLLNKPYALDSIYFRNQKVKLTPSKTSSKYVAVFPTKPKYRDLILTGDSKNEFGNQLPNIKKNIRFELEKDEAIISFQTKKGTQYYKIERLQQAE